MSPFACFRLGIPSHGETGSRCIGPRNQEIIQQNIVYESDRADNNPICQQPPITQKTKLTTKPKIRTAPLSPKPKAI